MKELETEAKLFHALKKEKQREHDIAIKELSSIKEEAKKDCDIYQSLCIKAKQDYIIIQGDIAASEKKLSNLKATHEALVKQQESGIARIKSRYESWKVNELDKVAKLKLKGKIDNIDKAGLKEILDV